VAGCRKDNLGWMGRDLFCSPRTVEEIVSLGCYTQGSGEHRNIHMKERNKRKGEGGFNLQTFEYQRITDLHEIV